MSTPAPGTVFVGSWRGVCTAEEWIEAEMKCFFKAMGRRATLAQISKNFSKVTAGDKRYTAIIVDFLKKNTYSHWDYNPMFTMTPSLENEFTIFFDLNDEVIDGVQDDLADEIERTLAENFA